MQMTTNNTSSIINNSISTPATNRPFNANKKSLAAAVVITIILFFSRLPTGRAIVKHSDLIHRNELLIDRLLPKDYDPIRPPKLNGEAVTVDIAVALLNIRSIKETELSYMVDLFYHQYWTDYRLQNVSLERIVLDNKWRDKLWIPDSYFKNALSGHVTDIIFPTLYFAVHNQTSIFMASRVSLQLSCDMRFAKFPHDTQECSIDIMSLSHNTDTVILKWKSFYLSSTLKLSQFYVSGFSHQECTKKYNIGTFSCLRATVKLTRQLGLYIVKKYIPSTLIVVMSFVGFWIPTNAYPARVALVITALLALITQQHQSAEVNVSYVIAINVWMIICITFVFFGLIEYAIAIAFDESHERRPPSASFSLAQTTANNQRGESIDLDHQVEMMNRTNESNAGQMKNKNIIDNRLVEAEADRNAAVRWLHRLMCGPNDGLRPDNGHADSLFHQVHHIQLQNFLSPNGPLGYHQINRIDVFSRYAFPIAFLVWVIMYLVYLYWL